MVTRGPGATGEGPAEATDPAGFVVEPTPLDHLDDALRTLRSRADAWCATDVGTRLRLLEELTQRTLAAAPAWVAAASAAKGIDPDSSLAGEEWSTSIMPVLVHLKGLQDALGGVLEHGAPQPPTLAVGDSGRVEARVYPADWIDRALAPGFTVDVRLLPDVDVDEAKARIGRIYREGHEPRPAVAAVLGAGNVGSIPALDVLAQLFAEDRVVILKMSPVNAYLGPHLAEAFEPLVTGGYLRIVYGDVEVADHLVTHADVDALHLTGSQRTHELIVFGDGDEARRRRADERPRIDKPVTSELGNVTPVIVVPGPWSSSDLAYHGDNLATMLVTNAGFNCITARVIVQHRAWSKRQALLDALRASLRQAAPRDAYYPGARERWERFVETYHEAERFGPDTGDEVPFTLIPELDPSSSDALAFTEEAFCGLIAEVALDAPRSVPEFVDEAVRFCNGSLTGTLAATLLVHPRSLHDPLVADAVERAVDELDYGVVTVNHWAGVAFGIASAPWGAAPGGTLADPGSGTGHVHNSYLLEGIERTIMRGPFRTPQVPGWFHTNRRRRELWSGAAELVATRNPSRLPSLLWQSLRG